MRSLPLALGLMLLTHPVLAQEAAGTEPTSTGTIPVAVIPLALPGGLYEQQTRLDAVLVSEVTECNLYKVISGNDLQAALGARGRGDLVACGGGTCLNEMLEVLGVQRVVLAQIQEKGSGYSVVVEMVGGPPGENRAELQWAGEEGQLEHVLRAATQLAAVPRAWHEGAGVKLKDLPQGATVYIDGRLYEPNDVGAIGPLTLGTHELLVEHPDYQEWKEPIVLGSGQLLEMPSELQETKIYHEWWFWTAIAAAAAVAVIVPVAVVVSKDPEPGHQVPGGDLGKIQLGVIQW